MEEGENDGPNVNCDYDDNGNDGSASIQDHADTCSREGCSNACCLTCAGCGIAGYCNELHMLEDWKNHVSDCSVAVHEAVGQTVWGVEHAEREEDDGTFDWVAADMVHAKVAENGLVHSSVLNDELVEKMRTRSHLERIEGAVVDRGFVNKISSRGAVKDPGVTPGQKKIGGTVHVTLAIFPSNSSQFNVSINQPFEIEDVSVASRNGQGTTVHIDGAKMKTIRADRRRNMVGEIDAMESADGSYNVTMRIDLPDQTIYTLNGAFSFAKGPTTARGKKARSEGYAYYASGAVAKAKYLARRKASRAAASIGKLPEFVRITGHDKRGVEGSLVFGHSRKSKTSTYTLRSFAIHVPAGIRGEVGLPPLPGGTINSAYIGILQQMQRDQENEGSDDNMSLMAPIDPESIEDVGATVEWLKDETEKLRQSYIGAQSQPKSAESHVALKTTKKALDETSRVLTIIENHCDVLNQEIRGLRDEEDIPVEVTEALAIAHKMIGISLSNRWKRMLNVRRNTKSLGGYTDAQLETEFLMYVDLLERARNSGQVGTQYLTIALALQEELLKATRYELSKQPNIRLAMAKLQKLRVTQSTDRRNKRDNSKLTNELRKGVNKSELEQRRRDATKKASYTTTTDDTDDGPVPAPPAYDNAAKTERRVV